MHNFNREVLMLHGWLVGRVPTKSLLAGRVSALGFSSTDTGGSQLVECLHRPLTTMVIYVTAGNSKASYIRISKVIHRKQGYLQLQSSFW